MIFVFYVKRLDIHVICPQIGVICPKRLNAFFIQCIILSKNIVMNTDVIYYLIIRIFAGVAYYAVELMSIDQYHMISKRFFCDEIDVSINCIFVI